MRSSDQDQSPTGVDTDEISGSRKSENPGLAERLSELELPYVGLRHYTSETASFQQGRERPIQEILELLREQSIVFVTGGSGSGKSSVVVGGVMPSLVFQASTIRKRAGAWKVLRFRPTTAVMDEFTNAIWNQVFEPSLSQPNLRKVVMAEFLPGEKNPTYDMLRDRIRQLSEGQSELVFQGGHEVAEHTGFEAALEAFDRLDRVLRTELFGHRKHPANLGIVLDQFEEIFRENTDHEQREKIFAMIRRLANRKTDGLFLIVTMRSEDLHRCAEVDGLAEIVNETFFLVNWLEDDKLQKALVQPAQELLEGVDLPLISYEPYAPYQRSVVAAIGSEVEDLKQALDHKSDYLPVYQHGLTYLWTFMLRRWQMQEPAVLSITMKDLDDMREELTGFERSSRNEQDQHWMVAALNYTVNKSIQDAKEAFQRTYRKVEAENGISNELSDALLRDVSLIAVRSAINELAGKDENGRIYRKFVSVKEVVRNRLSGERLQAMGLTRPKLLEISLTAAFTVFEQRQLLVCNDNPEREEKLYDVTHETLLRRSLRLSRWLDRESEAISTLAFTVDDGKDEIRESDIEKLSRVFGNRKGRGLARLFPHLVSHRRNAETTADGGMADSSVESNPLYICTFTSNYLASRILQRIRGSDVGKIENTGADADQQNEELLKAEIDEMAQRVIAVRKAYCRKLRWIKFRPVAYAAGIVLVGAIVAGIFMWSSDRKQRDKQIQLAELTKSYANGAYVDKDGFVLGPALLELKEVYKHIDEYNIYQDEMQNPESHKTEFAAHTALDERFRRIGGKRFLLRKLEDEVSGQAAVSDANRNCILVSRSDDEIAQLEVNSVGPQGSYDLFLDYSRIGDGSRSFEVDLHAKKSDSGANSDRSPVDFSEDRSFTPLQINLPSDGDGPLAEVCLSSQGRFIVLSRPPEWNPKGRAWPVPYIFYLNLVWPNEISTGDPEVYRLGYAYLEEIGPSGLFDKNQDLRVRSVQQRGASPLDGNLKISSLEDEIRIGRQEALDDTSFSVKFVAYNEVWEASFIPNLISPQEIATNKDGNPSGFDGNVPLAANAFVEIAYKKKENSEYILKESVARVILKPVLPTDLDRRRLAKKGPVPGLNVELIFNSCNKQFPQAPPSTGGADDKALSDRAVRQFVLINVTWLDDSGVEGAIEPEQDKYDCNEDLTPFRKDQSVLLKAFQVERVSHVGLEPVTDDRPSLVLRMKTTAGRQFRFPLLMDLNTASNLLSELVFRGASESDDLKHTTLKDRKRFGSDVFRSTDMLKHLELNE